MSNANDPLDSEIHVSGELTEHGVKGSAKLRALNALDRLVGNVVDAVNLPIEAWTTAKRSKIEGKKKVAAAIADAIAKQVGGDTELIKNAISTHYGDLFTKHENLEAVAAEAKENLRQISHQQLEAADNAGPKIDDDWMNFFRSYAEKASSETVRQMWGRILSGQIIVPNAFDFTTLRIVSELNAELATAFQEIASSSFTDRLVIRPADLRGHELHRYLALEAAGLLQEVGSNFGTPLPPKEHGHISKVFGPILVVGEPHGQVHKTANIRCLMLTSAGRQLATIIPRDEGTAARIFGEALIREGFDVTLYREFSEEGDNRIRFNRASGEKLTLSP